MINNLITFVDLVQGSEEWKQFRKGKIGSSSAASIMGVGFKTPLQLFEDMMEERETPQNEAMARGNRLEPIAREYLNKACKAALQPVVVQHPNPIYDWHISSIDGLCTMPYGLVLNRKEILKPGEIFVCEIKCPGMQDHNTALEGKVPDKYMPQCYHILEDLPGVNKILYFSYREDSVAMVWVERDEYQMTNQFGCELSFYAKFLSCRPPEPCEKDWIDFNNSDMLQQARLYSELQEQMKDLQEKIEDIKSTLIISTGCVSRARIGELKIQKVIRQGNIDYSQIEALKGVNLDQYRKPPIVTWRAS